MFDGKVELLNAMETINIFINKLKSLKKNLKKSFILYIIAGLLSSIWEFITANMVYKSTGNYLYSYFWLDPNYAFIQFANNMLLIGPFISSIIGINIKIKNLNNILEDIFILNIINVIFCSTSTYICFLIFNKYNNQVIHFNLLFKSIQMMVAFYIFINFWTLFGFLINAIFKKGLISSLLILSIQIFEIFIVPQLGIFNILSYMPTTLSREIIIKQFPFWIKGSWCYKLGVFSYANVTPILDNNYNIKSFNIFYVYFILLSYLLILYFILKFMKALKLICK